ATRALLMFGKCFESVGIAAVIVLAPLILISLRCQPAFLRHIPGVGALLIAKNLTYFLKTLAALLQARVDLLPALAQAQTAVTYPYLVKNLAKVPTSIAAGATLSEALAVQPHFPPLAVRLIRLGESTGRLPDLVAQAASGYQQHYAQRVERLVRLLHPALVMTLGLLILWIVLATLLPLYDHLDGGLGS
ncbi:MAG: type II secretion system F family protein, partial [Alphaproteobacteria bacterium]